MAKVSARGLARMPATPRTPPEALSRGVAISRAKEAAQATLGARSRSPLARITEVAWMRTVLDGFRVFGWVVFHDTVAYRSDPGYPDITAVHMSRQRVVWVELKTQAGKLSAAQEAWRGVLETAGQEWYCWRPSDWEVALRVMRGERLCVSATSEQEVLR